MTGWTLDRRQVLAGAAAAGLATTFDGLQMANATSAKAGPVTALVPDGVVLGEERPFSFDLLAQRAAEDAQTAWQPTPRIAPEVLDRIDYDAYQKIRFRPEMSLSLDPVRKTPVQLFHLGRMSPDPVKVHVVRGDVEQEIVYSSSLFESPSDHPAHGVPEGAGFAGFRIMAPDLKTDWLAFMGASYFRTSGPFDQYGLSARGLAIDTGLSTPEEFPRFTEFWLKGGGPDDADLTVYALLDSPSVTGAYEIVTRRTVTNGVAQIKHTIDARLFARRDINRLGIAPFSSMYWYGENSRRQIVDWRPEIHDSDGLAIWTGSGERIWRPLNNPPRVMVNTFVDNDVRGFGLLQRDRDFVHYLDDSVFYERRASAWIEPIESFGEGEVHLLEIPTDDEIHDNIAAYWCPREPFRAGAERRYRYHLSWLDDIPFPEELARTTATQTGLGGRPGQARPKGVRKFVVDFQGKAFKGLGREDGVEIVVTPTRGELSNAYCHPVVGQRNRWRAFFDLAATGDEPVDIRMYLRLGDRALTETWVYQYFPDSHV